MERDRSRLCGWGTGHEGHGVAVVGDVGLGGAVVGCGVDATGAGRLVSDEADERDVHAHPVAGCWGPCRAGTAAASAARIVVAGRRASAQSGCQ